MCSQCTHGQGRSEQKPQSPKLPPAAAKYAPQPPAGHLGTSAHSDCILTRDSQLHAIIPGKYARTSGLASYDFPILRFYNFPNRLS